MERAGGAGGTTAAAAGRKRQAAASAGAGAGVGARARAGAGGAGAGAGVCVGADAGTGARAGGTGGPAATGAVAGAGRRARAAVVLKGEPRATATTGAKGNGSPRGKARVATVVPIAKAVPLGAEVPMGERRRRRPIQRLHLTTTATIYASRMGNGDARSVEATRASNWTSTLLNARGTGHRWTPRWNAAAGTWPTRTKSRPGVPLCARRVTRDQRPTAGSEQNSCLNSCVRDTRRTEGLHAWAGSLRLSSARGSRGMSSAHSWAENITSFRINRG